jgi:hypothetical protein
MTTQASPSATTPPATTSPGTTNARSRRALLAGGLAGIGALAVQAIGRPGRAAAEGENIQVGGEYTTAESRTYLENLANNEDVFVAESAGSGVGVVGLSATGWGVYGSSVSGANSAGVYGQCNVGAGVVGIATGAASTTAVGVYARSSSTNAPALGARSQGNATAVLAYSGTGTFPTTKAKTAVYGYAAQDTSAMAIWGETTSGHAVHGTAASGYAGYFAGKVYTTKWYEMTEINPPTAPSTNRARLFLKDDGSGKTQLCVLFHTGAVLVLATQP